MKPVLSGTLAVSYYIPPLAPLGVAVSAGVGLAGLAMSELSNDSDVKKAGNEMLGVVLNAVEHREIAGNAVNGARAYNQISNYNSR